jgi:hypothetical protein
MHLFLSLSHSACRPAAAHLPATTSPSPLTALTSLLLRGGPFICILASLPADRCQPLFMHLSRPFTSDRIGPQPRSLSA